jgi:hypothetical protein
MARAMTPSMTAALPVQSPAGTPAQSTRLLLPGGRAGVPTTLRSASGETASDLVVAGTRRKGPIVVAVLGLAAALGGVGFWRMNAQEPRARGGNDDGSGGSGSGSGSSGRVVADVVAKVADIGLGRAATKAVTGTGGNVASAAGLAAGKAVDETHESGTGTGGAPVTRVPTIVPTHPPGTRTIKVLIASEPAGADVCLAKDRVFLGRTKLDWKTEKKPGSARLLIRKHGYHGDEITIDLEHDAKKAVTLEKLGPDDLDDSDICKKR